MDDFSIRFEEGISRENALLVCAWSNEKGRAFQEQWMGPQISFPLDCDIIETLDNLFSLFCREQFIGVIQKVAVNADSVHIGRFLLDPRKTGRGYGKAALEKFVDLIFADDEMKSVSLTVFDFNQNAKRLYEKLGFMIEETIETPKRKYIMRKHR